MKITIELIKELRKKTQLGISECKKALEQTNGNIEASLSLLKKQILCYSKLDKIKHITEGLTNVIVKNNKAILYELNTETSFAVLNKNFMELYDKIGNILLEADASVQNLDNFLNYFWKGQSIKDLILQKSYIVKEKIVLSRIQVVYKKDKESFGFYKHQGGKISSLVHLDNHSVNAQEYLPVHIVGMKPKFLSREKIDESFLIEQKNILLEQVKAKNTNKQLNKELLDKIVENGINSIIEKNCLLEQPFYMNNNQKVIEYLAINKSNVINYYFFEIQIKRI